MRVKLPDEFFDAMANRPRTEFDEWSERFNAALASAPTVDDATNYAALPIEGRDAFIGGDVVADFSDKFSLELLQETVAQLDVKPFGARPLIMSPSLAKACREAFPGVDVVGTERLPEASIGVVPQPFNASTFPAASRVVTFDASTSNVVFYDNLEILIDGEPIATYAPGSLTTIRWFGWLNSRKRGLRRQRRAKAKAKRAKMRAARYAARWEQAHLRGEK